MSGLAGLGSLIQGLQQGYSFADEMRRKTDADARKKVDDKFQDDSRAQLKNGWAKENSYDDDVKNLTDQFYPSSKPQVEPSPMAQPTQASMGTAVTSPVPDPAQDANQSPTLAGAGGSMAQPASPRQVSAAGLGTAITPAQVAPQASTPDPMQNTNKTLDFAMQRALLDVRHGKMDGAGLLTLQRTVDGMKSEKMDQAITLMNQGRTDEAMGAFNSTGDHSAKLISIQDGVFDAGNGVKLPTKIATIQAGDGSTRTINTAQALVQRQSMDKIIQQAQKGQEIAQEGQKTAETGRHNRAEEGIQVKQNSAMAGIAAGQLKLAQNRDTREEGLFKKQTLEGQLDDIETAIGGKLTKEERSAYAKGLVGLGPKGNKGTDDAMFNDMTKKYAENNPTAAPADVAKFHDGLIKAFSAVKTNAQVESAVREEMGKYSPGSAEYGVAYDQVKAQSRMNDAQLAAIGVPTPKQSKSKNTAAGGTLLPSTTPTPWQSPSQSVNAQASAGLDAAMAQTSRAIAAANAAGDQAEVNRLTGIFQQQSAAKQNIGN